MKRFLLSIISFGMFFTYANGACQGWEHGQIIPGAGQPNGSTAPKEYCWESSIVEGTGLIVYKGELYNFEKEDLRDKDETILTWFATETYHMEYGIEYYGIFFYFDIYGFPQSAPQRVYSSNGKVGRLIKKIDIASPSGNILNGTRYKYFIPYKKVSEVTSVWDLNIKSEITVFTYGNTGIELKDKIKIN